MAEKNQDLGITQKQDGDYTELVIPDLDLLTTYGLQVAWVYADKEKGTSEFSDVFEFTTVGPSRPEVTSIVWVWEGTTLKGTWQNPSPNAKTYQIYLTPVGATSSLERSWTKSADHTVTDQVWTLTLEDNIGNFNRSFRKQFTGKLKTTYLDGTTSGLAFTTPAYEDPVCIATISDSSWSVLSVPNGISVSWQDDITKAATYAYTNVYVSESESGPFVQYSGYSPIQIPLYNFNTHYVKIAHFSYSECESVFSSIKEGKAYDPITFDDDPPDPVEPPVTAEWNTDKALVVSYNMPAQNLPTYVKIFLTYNGVTKWFEKTVTTSTPSASTSSIINRQEFIDAFGESPNSFSAGYVTDMDVYRNENTTQVPISNITSVVKPNPLLGIVTTISVTGAANAYVVSSNLNPKATGIKVYQSSTENGTYTLVASSNSSPVIVYDEANAGNTVFVKAQWTTEDGNAEMSAVSSVTILDVGALSIIENPVKIKTDGSIFAGTLDANDNPVLTGARAVFNKRGFFLYDSNDENGLNPTTQIIGEDNGVTATFITKKAKIANWIISENKFENVLTSTTNTYTGLSPNGTYAFWAGGGVAGGYSVDSTQDAKFSVTPSGSVIARNIKVLGGEITVGSKFNVNTQGVVTATDVNLSGTIKASSGILGEVDVGGVFVINGVNTTIPGQLRVTLPDPNGGKVEIGRFTTNASGTNIENVGAGIQVTNTNGGWYAQLDPVNGIIAKRGSIGGWKIEDFILRSHGGKVGMKAPAIPVDTDVAFFAGAPEPYDSTSPSLAKFKVTYGGLLEAIDAKVYGTIKSNDAEFGTFVGNSFSGALSKGWYVDAAQIKSKNTTASGIETVLDGEWGAVKGANIIGSVFWLSTIENQRAAQTTDSSLLDADYSNDYISSAGHFRLASGKIRYTPTLGLIVKDTKIYLDIQSNEDNNFSDSTIVQDELGQLTTGRAFQYGGGDYPIDPGAESGKAGIRGRAFVKGDIWLSTKA